MKEKDTIEKAILLIVMTVLLFLVSLVIFKRIGGVSTPDKLMHMGIGIIITSALYLSTMKIKLNKGILLLLIFVSLLIFEFINDYSVHHGENLAEFYTGGDEMIDVYASLIGGIITFVFLSAD